MPGRKQAGDTLNAPSRRLADIVRDTRRSRGESQESVARAAGLAVSTVRKIESNRIREPGVFTTLALWRVLELPIHLLQELADEHGDHVGEQPPTP